MVQLGITQELPVLRELRDGWLLGDEDESVVLPFAESPRELHPGDLVRVFVFSSTHGWAATTRQPAAELGEFATLEVVDINEVGAFLDWGLNKELFVPYKEHHTPLRVGQQVVVAICLDGPRTRIMASTRLGPFLDYGVGHIRPAQQVSLIVYAHNDLGALVVVDRRHSGMVFDTPGSRRLEVGEQLEGFVQRVREDNKIDVQLRPVGVGAIDSDAERVFGAIEAAGGFLPLHDKSDPDAIRQALGMSKKAFKRAVGALLKAGRVSLERGGTRIKA